MKDGNANIFKIRRERVGSATIGEFSPRITSRPRFNKVFWLQPRAADQEIFFDNTQSLTPIVLFSPVRHYYPKTIMAAYGEPKYTCVQMHRILETERPDLVCLTPTPLNYKEVLEIATMAKKMGTTVICGGHQATATARLIMQNRPAIDAVCMHQGEEAIVEIVGGIPFSEIPNLVWRDEGGAIHVNPAKILLRSTILPELPNVDYAPWTTEHPETVIAPVQIQEGCSFRAGAVHYCEFCACKETYMTSLTPNQALQLLLNIKMLGFAGVHEVSQDLTGNKQWFDAFCDLAKHVRLPRIIQVSSRGVVTSDVAAKLSALGVERVFVGAESGSDRMLRSIKKGLNVGIQAESIRQLIEHGIRPLIGIVVGCSGETHETLEETRKFMLAILDLCTKKLGKGPYFEISPLSPRPGSPVWDELLKNPEFKAEYGDQDFPPKEEVRKAATPILTNGALSYKDLLRWIRKIRDLGFEGEGG
jgi:anaerobic magnesium-protoporphyrin IX monomethyl ester cyclase